MLTTRVKIKGLRNVLLVLIGIYVMIGSALFFFQERMIFLPSVLSEDYVYKFDVPFEELHFSPEPGVKINALHFKTETPKGVVFYSHGNAGDLSRWGNIASELTNYGYDVLVWDYRTYGKSVGTISEEAFYQDAQFIFDHLSNQFERKNIVLYGRSLGTGVASYLASKNKVQQLILETPYYSIADVAKHRFPFFPVQKLLKYKFPNYQFLPRVKIPMTILHGTDDAVIPIESPLKLKKLGLNNLKFITINGGSHNNLADFDGFHEAIGACLK
ncbi:MAG: alpha/beta fold hydrolase [Bacteroidota bacterium]